MVTCGVQRSFDISQRLAGYYHVRTHKYQTIMYYDVRTRYCYYCYHVHAHNYQTLMYTHTLLPSRTAWNQAGVDPVHYNPADVDPDSLISGTIQKARESSCCRALLLL